MKLGRPRFWIAVTSALLVLSVALVNMGKTSPGPLALVHERVPEMAGGRGCSECHGGWSRDMTQACLDCHEGIAGELEVRDGLHGVLEEGLTKRCALCHSDHHGADFAIVNQQSFARAGIPDRDSFDHRFVGFPMEGKHLELSCTECHENADVPVLPEGGLRYRGLDQNCGTCHEDSHEGAMQIGCIKCHGQESFDEAGLDSLGHEFFVPLIGGHEDLSCATCHEGEHTLDVIGRSGRPSDARACGDCHETPHEVGFLAGVAKLSGKSEAASCAVCHEAEHTSFREQGMELTRSQHAFSGFRLDAPHDDVGCADCHDPGRETFAERHPGRRADDCARCHEDPHGGQFDSGPFASQGCVACHGRQRFEPHGFTVEMHDETAMPLTGQHVETDCELCHTVVDEGQPRVFRGTPGACRECHEDAHEGFFVEYAAAVAELPSPDCGACHDTEGFTHVPEGSFEHGFWTGFPIDGAHAQSECSVCHEERPEPNALGRTFGRIEEHFGAYEGCVTCHLDPHAGSFDGPGSPQRVEGREDCARCHVTTSFRAFPDGFDHGLWTGFPLEDAHAEVGCTGCHEPLRRPTGEGRTWGQAAGKECADCHDDPHAGQFERGGRTNCARCHKSGRSFEALSFHHNWHSRFLLDEAHEKLACSACHTPQPAEGGGTVVRYRPLGMQCVDCHGVNEDQLLRERRGKGRRNR